MVTTSAPSASTASIVQLFTDFPSTMTTHAPHWLVAQPTCVPVKPRCSRSSCTNKVRPSTVADAGLPLTVRLTVFCMEPSLITYGRAVFCRGRGEFRAPPRVGQGASAAADFRFSGSGGQCFAGSHQRDQFRSWAPQHEPLLIEH